MGEPEYGRDAVRMKPARYAPILFVVAAVTVGIVLRLTWVTDMEYKGDERFMFDRSQHVGKDEPWPELGMESGVGTRNPGMSIWFFAVLARVFGATTPLSLDRAVILLNCAALVVLGLFALRGVPEEEREPWTWATALAAVNPIAIYLQRKIWAQSVLPLFCVLFLVGFRRRDRYWGAFLWGLIGAALGQVHMSGFFFAAGFFLWDAVLGRGTKEAPRPRAKWIAWVIGSAIASIPLLPWIRYVLGPHEKGPPYSMNEVLSFRFYRLWFSDTLGLGLDSSLGAQFLDFMRHPIFVKDPDLYPVLYLHGVSFSAGLLVAVAAAYLVWQRRRDWFHGVRTPLSFVRTLRTVDETTFALCAAFLGYGLLLTFASVHVWRHYLIVTFPLEWLACAAVARRVFSAARARLVLGAILVATFGISVAFLDFIHVNHGAIRGDYGPSYSLQFPRSVR